MDLSTFSNSHVMVIGDLMIDRYFMGNVDRISPEAPVPVLHVRKRFDSLGGAGNVVSNLVGLGCKVTVLGVCGKDEGGRQLKKMFQKEGVEALIFQKEDRPTIIKTRVLSSNQQLIRLDEEEIVPLDDELSKVISNAVEKVADGLDAIILSDYGKGMFQTQGLTQDLISTAQRHDIPVLVDPKGTDWERYHGASCITPNTAELTLFHGREFSSEDELIGAMRDVRDKLALNWLLVTRGALGISLLGPDDAFFSIPTVARDVFDVSGAGDTVISTLSLAVASGYSYPDAARLANLAAGVVVGKVGTQPINLFELKSIIGADENGENATFSRKIASSEAAQLQVQSWQANKEKVVFTNGCFDLLHPGHIHLLRQAKDQGERLIVGLNADVSVRRLKGSSRPILNENDRASLLSALDYVDLVVLFDQDTPRELISQLRPDILAKGADYSMDEVVGRDIVESYGGEVKLLQLLEGYSTTNLTKKIIQVQPL